MNKEDILFENSKIVVYKNQCDEIFIRNKQYNIKPYFCPTLRISPEGDNGFLLTADSCNFRPTSVNGLSGFVIHLPYKK